MSKARNIADLLDANGDVALSNLDNVPAADLVNDTSPQLGGDLDTNGNNVNFGDGDRLRLGAGADLQLFHDGFNSYVKDSGTGILYVQGSNGVQILGQNSGESLAKFNENGSVELYYDNNAKKLETTSTGIEVTGSISLGTDKVAKEKVRFTKSLTNTGFTTIATVNGTSFTSGVDLVLQGTGANGVVVNTTFHILVNHASDIYIESRNTYYSPVSIKVVSNGNEDFAIEAKYHAGSTPENITCVLEAHNNETIVQASSHSYTGATLEHYAEDGVTQNFTGTSSIGNYFKKDNTTIGSITWDGSSLSGAGKVLQVASADFSSGGASGQTTVSSGGSVILMSIVMTVQASSKVMMWFSSHQTGLSGSNVNPDVYFEIDGSNADSGTNHWFYQSGGRTVINKILLSNALSAGSHTFRVIGKSYNGDTTYNYQNNNGGVFMIQEIGA